MSVSPRLPPQPLPEGQLERELAYYRRECNALGARLLRLQEEQSVAFREARRSRTVAKLIREAYRLADQGASPEDLAEPMLGIVVDSAMCDRAALLREEPRGSERFHLTHALGLGGDALGRDFTVPSPPPFFFTTSRTRIEPPAYELTGILRLPYILWAYDEATGIALILGNQSESNVSRPFEEGDQELVEGALSVYIDVLLRKQAEVELRLAKGMAEEASSARSRFLATLTHELRTPLNGIIGFSEMMTADSGYALSNREREDYNGHILSSARHLLALINEILDYSSLARRGATLTPYWFPIASLVAESVGAAQGSATEREVSVSAGELPANLSIRVDRTRFRQVLDNLLSNAIRFTPPGGRVQLSARLLAPGQGLQIEVRDTGIGMRPEDVPRALEPFQQLDSPLNRASAGTGLGLPIAKGLVEAHGGTLDIRSALGEGTSVLVTLPSDCLRQEDAAPQE
ncbi:sensor histidine kinase [Roseomonas sp. BN140053]|uniref:sensor histidine kinase n=1 Tax=Roseomonas sp. BN140053 TaxID=3391898 RepID=UPI0039E7E06A